MILNDNELAVAQKTSFDVNIIAFLKTETSSTIFQSPNFIDDMGDGLSKNAIVSLVKNQEQAIAIQRKLRNNLILKGYYPFITQEHDIKDSWSITILKTNDQFEVIQFRKTEGIWHDIFTVDIVRKLNEWNDKYGVNLIGADKVSVSFEFKHLPENMLKFTHEISDFCPDIFDKSFKNIEHLKEFLSVGKIFTLRWHPK